MDFFQSVTAARVVFFLGILNFVLILLIFFSCRCVSGSKSGSRLMTQRFYKRFFAKHCYLWYIFWLSVTIHAFFAIMYLRWPG
jgi:hypothetical protein